MTNLKKRPGRTTGKVRKAKMVITKENCPNSVQDDKQFCANLAPPAGRRNRRRNKGEPFDLHSKAHSLLRLFNRQQALR